MTGVSLQSKLFAQLSWLKELFSGLDISWESVLAFSLMFAALPVVPGRTAPAYLRRTHLVEHTAVSLQSASVMLTIH
jgi:hypothetical protein